MSINIESTIVECTKLCTHADECACHFQCTKPGDSHAAKKIADKPFLPHLSMENCRYPFRLNSYFVKCRDFQKGVAND